MTKQKIIVPVDVLGGETVQPALATLLKDYNVVLVGIHVLPEQTAPGQAKEQFEEQAVNKLEQIAGVFEEAEVSVESKNMVFTHDRNTTINRQVRENDAVGYVIPNPVESTDDVLVTYQNNASDDSIRNILSVANNLFSKSQNIEVVVFGGVAEEEEERVRNAGFDMDYVTVSTTEALDNIGKVSRKGSDYDIVCMLEQSQSLHRLIFGDEEYRVARNSINPVVVVKSEEISEE